MRILVFGGTGMIGSQVVEDLATNHQVYSVGLHNADYLCDYTDKNSILELFESQNNLDAIICVVGNDFLQKEFDQLKDEDFQYGFDHKFLAQVRLVRYAQKYLNDNGSITLTSGYQSHFSTLESIAVGPLCAAIDTYIIQAAPLLMRGIRLNGVSPAPTKAPLAHPGIKSCSLNQVAGSYVASTEDKESGRIYKPWDGIYKSDINSEFVTHAA